MKRIEVPVLIVGGGPTGLTAGLLLARNRIRHHIVERRPGPQRAPAAHVINARTFEVWRQAGADMGSILAAAKDPRDAGSVHWVTQLGGESLGRLRYERQGDDTLAFTPTPLRNLSQHNLEPRLGASLRAAAGDTLHYRHEWLSCTRDDAGVVSRLRDLASGENYEVESRYVIACDGAGSPVRRALGIRPVGPDRIQAFVMIHFEANLRPLVQADPGVLFWISDPACQGTMVAHDIDREWVFMIAWDPDAEALADYTPQRCEAIVRRAIAGDPGQITIRAIASWMMTSQVAERYRDGRVFLAGDAAHRFPPTGGLGLNTGVQDAHNLVWKIAAVEHGWAGPSLLDSYETERKPIAEYNTEQSFLNAARLFEVPQAMGTTNPPEVAAGNFAAMLADPAQRATVRAAIERQAEHFDMLGLQLGFRYGDGAVIAERDDDATWPSPTNAVREFVPSARPGDRLPHAWVERDGRRISTLDLLAADRFTWIIGPQAEGLTCIPDVPTAVLRVGVDFENGDDWWTTLVRLPAVGGLLVRPDQHIGWRTQRAPGEIAPALARLCDRR